MAGRLMDAGYSLSIYDTQAEATKPLVARGARLAHSPAEVASASDIVLARILHVLSVVLWIGGVSMVTTILLPAIRRS